METTRVYWGNIGIMENEMSSCRPSTVGTPVVPSYPFLFWGLLIKAED